MSDKIDDGGPAFPTETATHFLIGMTLRDYFAAAALTRLAVANAPNATAAAVYEIADAMLRARREPQA